MMGCVPRLWRCFNTGMWTKVARLIIQILELRESGKISEKYARRTAENCKCSSLVGLLQSIKRARVPTLLFQPSSPPTNSYLESPLAKPSPLGGT